MRHITIFKAQQWVKEAWKFSPKKNVNEKDELLFLMEEIGEVAKAVRTIKGNEEKISKENLEKEFGDVLLSLLTIANRYDIGLEKGFKKSKKSTERRYMEKK